MATILTPKSHPMQIRIRQYSFHLSPRYFEGHLLTLAEAQALDRLRADNVRNNLARLVTDAMAELPDGQFLSHETLAEIQIRVTQYEKNYQFVIQHRSREKPGPLEAEIRAVAEIQVTSHLNGSGMLAGTGIEEFNQLVDRLMSDDAVQQEARLRLQRRDQLAQSMFHQGDPGE